MHNRSPLHTEITYLKGVGPRRAEFLASELNIKTFADLYFFLPFRYIDRSVFHKIIDIKNETDNYQFVGKITISKINTQGKGQRLNAVFSDESGSIQLVWFKGIKWIADKISPQKKYIVYGKVSNYQGSFSITHPEFEEYSPENSQLGLQAVYHSSEKLGKVGLNSKGIEKIIRNLISQGPFNLKENLNPSLLEKYHLISRDQAWQWIHLPPNLEKLRKAQVRLKFEELFFQQLSIAKIKAVRQDSSPGHSFKRVGENFNSFYNNYLPFELTKAQKKVVKEIRIDMRKPVQMNRLLQGDVGSGKTIVALLCMLIAIDNGYQVSLMAPTEILAQQHYKSISNYLKNLNINVKLLTGSVATSQRKVIHEELENGNLNILIGTHAIIEDKVQFKNLGLVIIDEQHRFGVAQRAKLWKKNTIPPDVLVMTATPIPRTMAMTLYGDLDYSVIDELPKGRKPIQTRHYTESNRLQVFSFMKKLIAMNQQVYVVYPLIEESESMDIKNLMEGYEAITRSFPLPQYRVGVVHGRMKPEAKEIEMQRFSKGKTQILVSTTVIEVGVDVPNASLMVIENANRFGLSQLHQLRGRVGRGASQSYCFLMSEGKLSADAKKRLATMVESSDGFKIAEVDLQLRGPGDMHGTRQSGILDLKIADIIEDEKILAAARKEAFEIIDNDPLLKNTKNIPIRNFLVSNKQSSFDWSKIS